MGWIIEPQDDHTCELPKITNEKKYINCQWQCDQCKKIYEVESVFKLLYHDQRDGPIRGWRNMWKVVSE